MNKWATQGWEEAEKQVSSGNYAREFFITDGEEVKIRVLTDEPINIRDHYVKGKGWFTCSQGLYDEPCPLCAAGYRTTNHSIFQVFDPREYKDKNDVVHKNEVKLWRVGVKLLRLLKLKAKRYGPLTNYDIDVSRIGSGTNTTYSIDVDIDSLNKEFKLPDGVELYDLLTVLEPKTPEEMKAIIFSGSEFNERPKGFRNVLLSNDDDNDDDDDDDEVRRLWGKN